MTLSAKPQHKFRAAPMTHIPIWFRDRCLPTTYRISLVHVIKAKDKHVGACINSLHSCSISIESVHILEGMREKESETQTETQK